MKYTDFPLMRWHVVLGFLVSLSSCALAIDLKAKSAILVEDRTGVVLYAKDPDSIRYPASITKILTAILLLERTTPTEMIAAPLDTETVEGASLHLKPGERISASDLLKAILLRSANDACHALAVHVAGSDAGFAKLMNDRAKQIGCVRSHFMAPHGLPNDKHYVTARDMALIARESMKFPEICQIVRNRRAKIERPMNPLDVFLISKNKWLDADPSAEGIKTGYTKVSGSTFVGAASRNGFRVITVILGSEDWLSDQKTMVDWAYQQCVRTAPIQKNEVLGTLAVADGSVSEVEVALGEDLIYAHRKSVEPRFVTTLVAKPGLSAPIDAGQEVGTATFEDGQGWKTTKKLFATESVQRSPIKAIARPAWFAAAVALGGSTIWMRRKSKRMAATIR